MDNLIKQANKCYLNKSKIIKKLSKKEVVTDDLKNMVKFCKTPYFKKCETGYPANKKSLDIIDTWY